MQSVLTYSVTKVTKPLTTSEVFQQRPQVKKQLWVGDFWSDGYFASPVGNHRDKGVIAKYVKNQGNGYLKLHRDKQLALF